MRENGGHTIINDSNIQCVEVVISRTYLRDNTNNLLWTLSVYSLQNQPVKKEHSFDNAEGFHFMVYDWNRTIKQLLEQNQIPYSIIGFFTVENIYPNAMCDDEATHPFLMA